MNLVKYSPVIPILCPFSYHIICTSLLLLCHQPIFTMSAQEQALQELSSSEYKSLKNSFITPEARIFFSGYKAEDVYRVAINGESSATWSISPPSRDNLILDLKSESDINVKFRYSFTRLVIKYTMGHRRGESC